MNNAEICGGNYESAMHYDCEICDKANECPFSKIPDEVTLLYRKLFFILLVIALVSLGIAVYSAIEKLF